MISEYGFDCKDKEYQKVNVGKAKDLSNRVIGRLTVLWRVKILNHDYGKEVFWLCLCECGNLIAVAAQSLTRINPTQSCGCLQKEVISKLGQSSRTDLTGKIHNGIEFLRFNQQYKIDHHIKSKNAYWDCKCHCGQIFTANSGEILQNRIISCGCLGTSKSKGEVIIENILKEHNIKYIYDLGYFKDLKLPSGVTGRYDFILLDDNNEPYRIIEFDGRQHYTSSNSFDKTEQDFQDRLLNDKIKNEYALQHHIPLVRIPYTELKNLSWELLMDNRFLITE